MENLDMLIADLALILVAAGLVSLIFKKLNQPVVLAYIVAGFLISPNFTYLPTVVETGDIHVWANIGIVFLMFGLGLEFSFKKIATVGGSAFVVAMTVMTAMIIIGYVVGELMGWSHMDSIFLGGMLSMSSTMIILKAYEEYNMKKEKFAQLVLGTLVIEDIGGIFMMIILSTIAVSQNASGGSLFTEIGFLLLCLVVWLVLGIYLIPTFLNKFRKMMNDELLLIVVVGLCMAMVVIANLLGFSSALGAFMAGSILAGTVEVHKFETLVKPLKDLFGAVFFVSVGMLIEPKLLVEYIVPILIITVVVIIGQMSFVTIGILLSGNSVHTAIRGGFSMVQIGEFSFIVASLGMTLGVISDFLYPIIICVSVITTFTTPVFIKNAEKVYKIVDEKMPSKLYTFLHRHTSETRSKMDKDYDWQNYMKKFFIRVAISGGALFLVFFAGTKFLNPFIAQYVDGVAGDVIATVITAIVMVPLINLMLSTNDVLYDKLWLKSRSNRLPLLALSGIKVILICGMLVMMLRVMLELPYWLLIITAFISLVLIEKADYLDSMTIKMEMQFMENFYESTLERERQERNISGEYHWLDESLYEVEFFVTKTLDKNTLQEFFKSPFYKVTVIKVIRKGKHYNMPNGRFEILEGDMIHAIGTLNEVETCQMMLKKADHIQELDDDIITLREYIYGQTFHEIPPENQIICCPIQVEADSHFLKKTVKNSGFRSRYKGYIVGIERGKLPLVNPDKNMIIEKGDLLWVIGTQKMANSLLKADMLDEEDWI